MRHSSHALTAKSGLVSELALQLIAYYPAHLPYPPKNAQYALEAVPENDSCKDFMDEARVTEAVQRSLLCSSSVRG